MANTIKAPASVPETPNLRVIKGVSVETTPNAISGKEVSKPSIELESPVLSRIKLTNGPTPASAGRKLRATNTIPIIKSVWEACFVIFDF